MDNQNSEVQERTVVLRDDPGAVVPVPDGEKAVRKKVRKVYNAACAAMLIQFGIATAISGIISFVYTMILTVQLFTQAGEPDIMAVMEKVSSPLFLLIVTAVSYLIANVSSFFIGDAMIKRHHRANVFGRIQLKPLDCLLAVAAILGIQMLSALIQSLIVSITGYVGVDETTAGLLTVSDDTVQNIILVVYAVIIGAVTEELLCRGVVLKALSVKSPTFGLVASALLFGIMHGNFNQMFNGFLLGLVIGYAAIKSKSIFLPIILHVCANAHAMLLTFFEYKLGESMLAWEYVYIIVMAVIGIGALILLVKRNGMPKDKTDGYPVTAAVEGLSALESQKGLTWASLFKTPIFWIYTVVFCLLALMSITAIA